MLRSPMKKSVRADSTLSACIRSLPLAVLHQLHFQVESALFKSATGLGSHFGASRAFGFIVLAG